LIFNDYVDGRLVSRVVTIEGQDSVVPFPIQSLHPLKPVALSLNYRRLARLRPEYGYAMEASNFTADQPLDRDGVWRIDLESGASELLISIAQLAHSRTRGTMRNSEHKVNHTLYSPGGDRFVFLHRWVGANGRFSRLYVAGSDGGGLRLLLDERLVSHYSWADETHLLVWARTRAAGDHYYLMDVTTGKGKVVGLASLDVYGDGHLSPSPNGEWIVTDSYPDRARVQHLLLYRVATGAQVDIGRFFAPWRFVDAMRCDLHPRWSPDGRWICVDSAHSGTRMTYVLDISAIVSDTSQRAFNPLDESDDVLSARQ
jgi:Tol biopolymer transport system component